MLKKFGFLPIVVGGLALLIGAISALAASGVGNSGPGISAQNEVCDTATPTVEPNGTPTPTATASEDAEDEGDEADRRVAVGVLVRRVVLDRCRVEDHHVRDVARCERAPPGEPEGLGRESAQPPDCLRLNSASTSS